MVKLLCTYIRALKMPLVYITNGHIYGTDYNFMILKHMKIDLSVPYDICLDKNEFELLIKQTNNNLSQIEINDFRKSNFTQLIQRVCTYLSNYIFYHDDDIRTYDFDYKINRPTSEGIKFYNLNYSNNRLNTLLPLYKGLLNLTKKDLVSLDLHYIDYAKYFSHFIIHKSNKIIIDVYMMLLYL